MRKTLSLLLSSIIIVSTLHPMYVEAAEQNVTAFSYTGDAQQFVAPYTGEYEFQLSGAQGGNKGTKVGGKGGSITAIVSLKRGDIVTIEVGGQDGYHGGGNGKVSCGGGSTSIEVNSTLYAIAGGGGGATEKNNGGAGGAANSGNNSTLYLGTTDTTTQGSAGGGGGYYGGTAGYYYTKTGSVTYTVYWDRTGGITTGAEDFDLDGTGRETWRYNYAKSDYRIIKTEPASSISATVSGENTWDWRGDRYSEPYYFAFTSSYGNRTIYMGSKDITPVNFTTSYTNSNATVTYNKASYGGSSWFASSLCSEVVSEEGTQEGNGQCTITLLSIHQLFHNDTRVSEIYYNNIRVNKVYFNGKLIYLYHKPSQPKYTDTIL